MARNVRLMRQIKLGALPINIPSQGEITKITETIFLHPKNMCLLVSFDLTVQLVFLLLSKFISYRLVLKEHDKKLSKTFKTFLKIKKMNLRNKKSSTSNRKQSL